VVNFVGEPDPAVVRRLEGHGAEIRVVEPMHGNGMANKLRMLELDRGRSFDVLVALDCDVVVVDDFSDALQADEIRAKPVDFERFGDRDWARLYALVGLDAPVKEMQATSSGRRIPPYFNSGVVTVPHALCERLEREWSDCYALIAGAIERDRDWLPRHVHWLAEQSALSLAIVRAGLPYGALPLRLNFPTHVPVHASAGDDVEPAILHYHGELDADGFLLKPRSPLAIDAAERFNSRRAEVLGIPYAGLRARSWGAATRRRLERRLRQAFWRRQTVRSRWRELFAGSDPVSGRGRTQP
jgi:hypothetical protein